jgi:hypothetical protein
LGDFGQLRRDQTQRPIAGSVHDLCIGVSGAIFPGVTDEQEIQRQHLFATVDALGDISSRG